MKAKARVPLYYRNLTSSSSSLEMENASADSGVRSYRARYRIMLTE